MAKRGTPPKKEDKSTRNGAAARRARFAEEYLVDRNATQAAIRAGYSKKTAHVQGHDLLSYPEVKQAVEAGEARLRNRTQITQERVIQQWANIAFSDLRDAATWQDGWLILKPSTTLLPEIAAAVSEVKQTKDGIGIKLYDKTKALDALSKHLGLYRDLGAKLPDVIKLVLSGLEETPKEESNEEDKLESEPGA